MTMGLVQDTLTLAEHRCVRIRTFISVEVSDLSTFCNTLCNLMFEVSCSDHTVRTFVNSTKVDTLDEAFDNDLHTFDVTCFSNESLREVINDDSGVGELHGCVPLTLLIYMVLASCATCVDTTWTVTVDLSTCAPDSYNQDIHYLI